jgi:hypothetical protein
MKPDSKNDKNDWKKMTWAVAELQFFKWQGKLITNTILYRHALEINSKHIF